MKKYFSIIIFSIVLIPQVTFASWWNPISWKIFRRTDNKTQILENRIKELENKIENKTTSTTTSITKEIPSTSTTTKKVETKIPTKPKVNPTQNTKSQPIYTLPDPTKPRISQEDPLIKIERCKNASEIASDERRLRNTIGIELLSCMSQSNCSYENTKSLLDTLLQNSKASTYKSTYDRCLTSSRSDFESDNLTIENYWQQCEAIHSGSLRLSLYNERQECVTSLVVTKGI